MKMVSSRTSCAILAAFLCNAAVVVVVVVVSAKKTASLEFEPYSSNGGLVSAIAGKDFVVVATDTRLSNEKGYTILGRRHVSSRLWTIGVDDEETHVAPDGSLVAVVSDLDDTNNDNADNSNVGLKLQTTILQEEEDPKLRNVWIASAGCQADCEGLKRNFRSTWRAVWGTYTTPMSPGSLLSPASTALALHHKLYSRRGFPYYAFCLVAGLTKPNTAGGGTFCSACGRVYAYDAIGSYEQVTVACAGTGQDFLQPILDRLFCSDDENAKQVNCASPEEAVEKLVQAYRAVAEREIAVGDGLVLVSTQWKPDGKCETKIWSSPLKGH